MTEIQNSGQKKRMTLKKIGSSWILDLFPIEILGVDPYRSKSENLSLTLLKTIVVMLNLVQHLDLSLG
jgi:hypothetical protein